MIKQIDDQSETHFQYQITGKPYSIVITNASVDGVEIQEGDEIAVFDGETVAGAGVFDGVFNFQFPAWEKDELNNLPGFTVGNQMYFRIWNRTKQIEYPVAATYIQGDGRFGSGAISVVSLGGSESSNYFSNFIKTGKPYSIVITNAVFNGRSLEEGDEIGVFDGNTLVGSSVCTSFPMQVIAWQEDSLNGLNGFKLENSMLFKIWIRESQTECISSAAFERGNGTFGHGDFSVAALNAADNITFEFDIHGNRWNWISLPLTPNNPDIGYIASQLHTLQVVADDDGNILIPELDVNTIGQMNPAKGYYIYTRADETIQIQGNLIDVSHLPIFLKMNKYNVISYPFLIETPLSSAMTSIIPEIAIVQSINGRIFIPDYGINTIGNLIPGNAYRVLLKSATDRVFYYPNISVVGENYISAIPEIKDNDIHSATTNINNLYFTIVKNEMNDFPEQNDIVLLVSYDGKQIGSGNIDLSKSINVIDCQPEDNLQTIINNKHLLTFEVSENTVNTRNNIEIKTVRDPTGVDAKPYSVVELTNSKNQNDILVAYPNPFNNQVSIKYTLNEKSNVNLMIYNILGQLEINLKNEIEQAGEYTCHWNGINQNGSIVSSGVYLLVLRHSDKTLTQKILFLK